MKPGWISETGWKALLLGMSKRCETSHHHPSYLYTPFVPPWKLQIARKAIPLLNQPGYAPRRKIYTQSNGIPLELKAAMERTKYWTM